MPSPLSNVWVPVLVTSNFGSGTSSIATAFGGTLAGSTGVDNVEDWNGTSWVAAQTLNTARGKLASSGAVGTAGLAIGGSTDGSTDGNFTEEWYGDGHVTEKISSS